MGPESTLAVIMFGALFGLLAVLYAERKGYLGRTRRNSTDLVTPIVPHAAPKEEAMEVPDSVTAPATVTAPTTVTPPAVDPMPSPFQAIYETVQPTPAPAQYTAPPTASFEAPSTTSFGSPSITKPTRTYRRRPAPVWSATSPKASLKQKTKKR